MPQLGNIQFDKKTVGGYGGAICRGGCQQRVKKDQECIYIHGNVHIGYVCLPCARKFLEELGKATWTPDAPEELAEEQAVKDRDDLNLFSEE